MSYWSLPMSGANSYNSLAVQDTIGVGGRMIYATGGYTRVFHMQEEQGRTFAALPIGINNVMLSQAIADAFKKRLPEFSLNTPLTWRGDTVNTVTQGGIVGSFCDYRYGDDAHWIFMRLGEQLMREEFGDQQAQIVFRVKPAADGPDYREQFLRRDSAEAGHGQYICCRRGTLHANAGTVRSAVWRYGQGEQSDNSGTVPLGKCLLGTDRNFLGSYAPSSLGNSLAVGDGQYQAAGLFPSYG